MKRYLFKNLVYLLILFSFLTLPLFSLAASSFVCPAGMSISDCQKQKLGEVYGKSYGATAESVSSLTISQKIGLIVSYALAFLGVIFLVLVVFSGFQWMTAGGNEEKITQARTRLINAVLGLTIILSAYAITYFVVDKLADTSGYSEGVMQTAEECDVSCCGGGTQGDLLMCQPGEYCRKVGGGDPGDPADPCAGCGCVAN